MAGTKNDVLVAKNADFSQAGAPNSQSSESNGLITNGQLWIGTTNPNVGGTHINVGALSSPDGSITFNYSSPNITATISGGSTSGKTISGNTGGALSPSSGNWNIYGSSSLAGSSPVTTSGLSNTLTVNVQTSQAIASTDATKVGLSAFDSAKFSVDANGFVSLVSGVFVQSLKPDDGVDVFPNGSGNIEVDGSAVANSSHIKPLFFKNNGFNVLQADIQYSAAIESTDGTKTGISNYDRTDFTVDANGFVASTYIKSFLFGGM